MDQFLLGLLNAIHGASMSYTAARYFMFVIVAVVVYYALPKKIRWLVLLSASVYFYFVVSTDWIRLGITIVSVLVSYISARLLRIAKKMWIKKCVLGTGIVVSAMPLFASKLGDFIIGSVIHKSMIEWIVPIGMSFYSMQIISYLVDIYRDKIEPEKNPLKYTLYVIFFPTLIQGPISRYDQLSSQLIEGHDYDNDLIMRGIQLILWGLFLKYLIADKASVVVDTVFNNYSSYSGLYIWIAAILYSLQLYTDFLSCVTISQGVAELFGITLIDNFYHPYFSTSIKDFWRRWHISLSEWLKDYVYISLGGNRKGKIQKYINLIITFSVSGIWHGGRWKYLFWGLMHAAYQIIGDLLHKPKDVLLSKISLPKGSKLRIGLEMITTSFLVMTAWIIFRAESLNVGVKMILSMFSAFNPWILFDNSIFCLGLSQKEMEVLLIAVGILMAVSTLQEKGIKIRAWFNRQGFIFKWIIYLCVICGIWVFGTYGYGFNSSDFIYGGF